MLRQLYLPWLDQQNNFWCKVQRTNFPPRYTRYICIQLSVLHSRTRPFSLAYCPQQPSVGGHALEGLPNNCWHNYWCMGTHRASPNPLTTCSRDQPQFKKTLFLISNTKMVFSTGRKWRLIEMRPRNINQSRNFYRLKTQVVKRIGLQAEYAHVGRQVNYRTVCSLQRTWLTCIWQLALTQWRSRFVKLHRKLQ